MSAAAAASGIICQSAIQTRIGDGMRGRVMSMWASVAIGSSAMGAAVLGIAVEILGLGVTLTSVQFPRVCCWPQDCSAATGSLDR